MKPAGLVAVLALACVTMSLDADQQAPSTLPTFRTGVNVVPLDVTVLDADRRPVRGLTAADFRVVADGEERPIVAFEALELPDRSTAGAGWLKDVTPDVSTNGFVPDRILVLMLDDWNTVTGDSTNWSEAKHANSVRKIGHAVVDELGPTDLVGVAYPFQTQRGVDFTTDRAKLHAAVDRFTVARPSNIPGETAACPRNSCVPDVLRAVVRALAAWPDRRKLLVYVSPQDAYRIGPQNVEQNASEANAAAVDMGPALLDTLRALQRANVTVYQFDPRGLEDMGSIENRPGIFADATGGWTASFSNEPWRRAPQMFAENDSYYMLGIQTSGLPARSGFHPLRVTVGRRDATVQVRRGYYDLRPEPPADAPAALTALDRAMTGPVPRADLPLSLTTAAFRVAGSRRAAVVVAGGVDRAASHSAAETVEVAVRAFDERSAARESRGLWTSTLQLRPQESSIGTVHYDTLTRLDLPPGAYEIRLSMKRASDTAAGGVAASLLVPDFDGERLSVSGVILGRPGPGLASGGGPLGGLLPFRPTTRRTFARGEAIAAMLRVYQGGKDATKTVAVAVRIVDQQDATVFDATTDLPPAAFVGPTRAAEFQLGLPVAKLTTGEYLLRIEATLDRRIVPATQVRFRVKGGPVPAR